MTLLTVLTLGFFLGMRHATDADHVVAVTTLVSQERSKARALWLGGMWGVGHSMTILAFGGAMVLFGMLIPVRLGLWLELSVAVMLVLLGVLSLMPDPSKRHRSPRLLRPVLVGIVHGLAGSAAAALLGLASVKEPVWRMFYLLVFGAGTVLGMMILSTVMVLSLSAVARRIRTSERLIARGSGLASIALGLFLAWEVGLGLQRLAP